MNYEVIMGDVEYEWSLGVFSTKKRAQTIATDAENKLLQKGHALGDHEFAIEETKSDLRGAIMPAHQDWEEWMRGRKP